MDQTKLIPMMQGLGALGADGASYSGALAEDCERAFVEAFRAKLNALNGKQASPIDFINDGFTTGAAIAGLTGNEKAVKLVDDLQKTEQDAVAGKVIPAIEDLVTDYHDIRDLAKK